MTTKQIIRKIVFVALTLTACSGLVVLLVAAIGRKNHELCKGYAINIKGDQKKLFIDETDVKKILDVPTQGKIKDQPITGFNLRRLEQQIKGNAWVEDANLYFDNKDVLHVSITEKEPIARIFTSAGKSFYLDSSGDRLPLSDLMSARVPVFTNFPDKRNLSTKDSILLNDVKKTASYILNDPFWMAQTEQIDITQDRNFEMIPTIGNHIVRLGNSDDIDQKLHRLMIFYQQIMSKSGFDRYKVIDVQYAGQVIGTREKISKVDSVQLRKNVEKLLLEARKMQQDTTVTIPVTQSIDTPEEQHAVVPEGKQLSTSSQVQNNSTPVKTKVSAKPKLIDQKKDEKKPKAVMGEKA